MKKSSRKDDNFVDALGEAHRYAVLTKGRRIQVVVRPTAKQLRKRGKRGWELYGTVGAGPDAAREVADLLRRAVAEAEAAGVPAADSDAKAAQKG